MILARAHVTVLEAIARLGDATQAFLEAVAPGMVERVKAGRACAEALRDEIARVEEDALTAFRPTPEDIAAGYQGAGGVVCELCDGGSTPDGPVVHAPECPLTPMHAALAQARAAGLLP